MKKLIMCFVLACVMCGTCFVVADEIIEYKAITQIPESDINYLSAYTLVASPKDYDGKKIRVVGKLRVAEGNNSLYVDTESYDLKITKNALWCNINPYTLKTNHNKIKELDGKFVMIEGVFNGLNTGHTNYYSGAIENISLIKEWK